MYDYIKGTLVSKNLPCITVECGNIGYLILTNARSAGHLGECGSEVKVYTKLIHTEDAMFLCGFAHRQERVIFDTLVGVSGIGVKVALVLLDEFEIHELVEAVVEGDYKLISRAKGVGPKLAQKICLELKDKLTNAQTTAQMICPKNIKNASAATVEEVQTILGSLGWGVSEYANAVEQALKCLEKDDAQELLRLSLKILSE